MLYSSLTILSIFSTTQAFRMVKMAPMNSMMKMNAITLDGLDSSSMAGQSNLAVEDLIAEEMVTDSASASALADRCMEEAER